MWIYQQPDHALLASSEGVAVPIAEASASVPEEPAQPVQKAPEQALDAVVLARKPGIQTVHSKASQRLKTTYCMLISAFLLGSIASGCLCAFCSARQAEFLQIYLQCWNAIFAASGPNAAAKLFSTEYFTLAGAATILLLLGFSAFGPVLVFLFYMFYGLGSGTLLVQFFANCKAEQLPALIAAEAPAAAAVLCLCSLGVSALRVSGHIHAYSLGAAGQARCGAGALAKKYLLTLVLLVPLCGLAAAFACIGSQI